MLIYWVFVEIFKKANVYMPNIKQLQVYGYMDMAEDKQL